MGFIALSILGTENPNQKNIYNWGLIYILGIWESLCLLILSWISIVIIGFINESYHIKSLNKGFIEEYEQYGDFYLIGEMIVKDANYLLGTGIACIISTIICYFIKNSLLKWGIFVLLVWSCVCPLIKMFKMIYLSFCFRERHIIHGAISSLIRNTTLILLVFNIVAII